MSDYKVRQDKNVSLNMPQSVAFGSIFGVAVTVVLLIAFALVLTFSAISDVAITVFSYLSTIVGAFAGSYFASGKIRKNGLFVGFLTFALYLLIMFIIKVIFSVLGDVTVWTLAYVGVTLLFCLIGGVAGVNTNSHKKNN